MVRARLAAVTGKTPPTRSAFISLCTTLRRRAPVLPPTPWGLRDPGSFRLVASLSSSLERNGGQSGKSRTVLAGRVPSTGPQSPGPYLTDRSSCAPRKWNEGTLSGWRALKPKEVRGPVTVDDLHAMDTPCSLWNML